MFVNQKMTKLYALFYSQHNALILSYISNINLSTVYSASTFLGTDIINIYIV